MGYSLTNNGHPIFERQGLNDVSAIVDDIYNNLTPAQRAKYMNRLTGDIIAHIKHYEPTLRKQKKASAGRFIRSENAE
jgi:hypothetical protein